MPPFYQTVRHPAGERVIVRAKPPAVILKEEVTHFVERERVGMMSAVLLDDGIDFLDNLLHFYLFSFSFCVFIIAHLLLNVKHFFYNTNNFLKIYIETQNRFFQECESLLCYRPKGSQKETQHQEKESSQ